MGNLKANTKVNGVIRGRCYDQSRLPFWKKLWNKAVIALELDRKKHYFLGPLKWEKESKNVVCNAGFAVIGGIFLGSYGGAGEVTHAALGSSSAAVAASDTTLTTEVYRNTVFSGAVEDNVTYLTAFYTEAETSGTYEEFGFFIDGAAGADTGEMWNHYLTGGWVKTGSDALVVDGKFTFSS